MEARSTQNTESQVKAVQITPNLPPSSSNTESTEQKSPLHEGWEDDFSDLSADDPKNFSKSLEESQKELEKLKIQNEHLQESNVQLQKLYVTQEVELKKLQQKAALVTSQNEYLGKNYKLAGSQLAYLERKLQQSRVLQEEEKVVSKLIHDQLQAELKNKIETASQEKIQLTQAMHESNAKQQKYVQLVLELKNELKDQMIQFQKSLEEHNQLLEQSHFETQQLDLSIKELEEIVQREKEEKRFKDLIRVELEKEINDLKKQIQNFRAQADTLKTQLKKHEADNVPSLSEKSIEDKSSAMNVPEKKQSSSTSKVKSLSENNPFLVINQSGGVKIGNNNVSPEKERKSSEEITQEPKKISSSAHLAKITSKDKETQKRPICWHGRMFNLEPKSQPNKFHERAPAKTSYYRSLG